MQNGGGESHLRHFLCSVLNKRALCLNDPDFDDIFQSTKTNRITRLWNSAIFQNEICL